MAVSVAAIFAARALASGLQRARCCSHDPAGRLSRAKSSAEVDRPQAGGYKAHVVFGLAAGSMPSSAASLVSKFHFEFASFFPEFLFLKLMFLSRQLEFSEQNYDVLLLKLNILFCGDKLELQKVVSEKQEHNTELRSLDTQQLGVTPRRPHFAPP